MCGTLRAVEPHLCSARGCTAAASWDQVWRNPRLHTPERRKVWLGCEEHQASLGDFLGTRGFLIEVLPHDPQVDRSV